MNDDFLANTFSEEFHLPTCPARRNGQPCMCEEEEETQKPTFEAWMRAASEEVFDRTVQRFNSSEHEPLPTHMWEYIPK